MCKKNLSCSWHQPKNRLRDREKIKPKPKPKPNSKPGPEGINRNWEEKEGAGAWGGGYVAWEICPRSIQYLETRALLY